MLCESGAPGTLCEWDALVGANLPNKRTKVPENTLCFCIRAAPAMCCDALKSTRKRSGTNENAMQLAQVLPLSWHTVGVHSLGAHVSSFRHFRPLWSIHAQWLRQDTQEVALSSSATKDSQQATGVGLGVDTRQLCGCCRLQ